MSSIESRVDPATLDNFFRPRSVAIIGLSRRAIESPVSILATLKDFGYAGEVYVVNPSLAGVDGAFASVPAIGKVVDLAVITVERRRVLEVLRDCAAAGVPAAIVISQGFADADAEGRAMQEAIVGVARAHGMRILGPNTIGVTNAFSNFTSSFFEVHNERWPIASISQSGLFVMGHCIVGNEPAGFGIGVDIGNASDVGLCELLRYFERDPEIRVIQCHVESIPDGVDFLATVSRVSRAKPIVVFKTGRSSAGARAVMSHSGALAGEAEAASAAFAKSGVVEASSAEELRMIAKAFAIYRPPNGRRVAVMSFSGGAGIMAADALEDAGLILARYSDKTYAALRELFPEWMEVSNPLDVWVPVSRDFHAVYPNILGLLMEDEGVDAVMCIYPSFTMPKYEAYDSSRHIRELAGKYPEKPIVCWSYGMDMSGFSRQVERERSAMVFPTLDAAARILAKLAAYDAFCRRPHETQLIKRWPCDSRRATAAVERAAASNAPYSLVEALELLSAYGVPVAPYRLAVDRTQLAQSAHALGFPLCLKVVTPELVHKTDQGGVVLDLRDAASLGRAYDDLLARFSSMIRPGRSEGVLVQEMAKTGREVLIGLRRDAVFGPCVLVGAGGIFAEVLNDVSLRLAPLDEADARSMVDGLRFSSVLKGARGEGPVDLDAIVAILLRVSQIACDHPCICEIDINPLIVHSTGAVAVDARIRVN